jgi:hypothetical protein
LQIATGRIAACNTSTALVDEWSLYFSSGRWHPLCFASSKTNQKLSRERDRQGRPLSLLGNQQE